MGQKLIDNNSFGYIEGTSKEEYIELNARVLKNTEELFYELTDGSASVELVPAGQRIHVSGALTGDKKVLTFSAKTANLSGISSVTVDAFRGNIRHVGGGYIAADAYVTGGYNFSANYTVTAVIGTDNSIEIRVTANAAYDVSAPNNTPLDVEINALIVTFRNDA